MDPVAIAALISALADIAAAAARLMKLYTAGELSEEELIALHTRVRAFQHAIQLDADTLRGEEDQPRSLPLP